MKVVSINIADDLHETLIALLDWEGYEAFEEREGALMAYTEVFDESVLQDILSQISPEEKVHFEVSDQEEKNWNEEWEKNFHPVVVDEKVLIRAHFHNPEPAYPHEVIITPKMSFGTGHHDTTYLMVRYLLVLPVKNKQIADAGCGTGILAILAEKFGADKITAWDFDEWAYENAKENISLNHCERISVYQGTVKESSLGKSAVQLFLANINKNVLLEEIQFYYEILQENGYLVLSGFYENDAPDIREAAESIGLRQFSQEVQNEWSAICFQKVK